MIEAGEIELATQSFSQSLSGWGEDEIYAEVSAYVHAARYDGLTFADIVERLTSLNEQALEHLDGCYARVLQDRSAGAPVGHEIPFRVRHSHEAWSMTPAEYEQAERFWESPLGQLRKAQGRVVATRRLLDEARNVQLDLHLKPPMA